MPLTYLPFFYVCLLMFSQTNFIRVQFLSVPLKVHFCRTTNSWGRNTKNITYTSAMKHYDGGGGGGRRRRGSKL